MPKLVAILGLLEVLVAVTAISTCSFLFVLLSRTRLLHTTFRTSVRIFSVAVAVYMFLSIIIVALCTFHPTFSRVYHKQREDLFVFDAIREMQYTASFSFWLALSFVTIERAIATHFVSSYERQFNSPRSQLRLIALFIFVDVVENSCRVLFPLPAIAIVCFSNTFINLGVMYFIKRINTRRDIIERDLSYRYQVKENVLISSAILPLNYIIIVFSFALLPFIFMIYIFLGREETFGKETREILAGIFYSISAIFPLTYALGLLRSAALRKVMVSQGYLKEKRETLSSQLQYEATRSRQNELWRVAKRDELLA